MFQKEEPTINNMNMDSEGNVDIKFSSEMDFPDNWVDQYNQYQSTQRRLQGKNQPLLKIQTKNAVTGEITDLDANQEIRDLQPDKLRLGVLFDNPNAVSQGS
jgi:hypothetical protein